MFLFAHFDRHANGESYRLIVLLKVAEALRVVSRAGLFGSGSGRVRAGFGPKVDKNVELNSGLRLTFCLRCTKK